MDMEGQTMIDLDAIRARDAEITDPDFWPSAIDRRALLAYVDALVAAAGKVTCWRCEGFGELKSPYEEGAGMDDADPCPDCADLRRLLGEGHDHD
jgi:hypothetical protein